MRSNNFFAAMIDALVLALIFACFAQPVFAASSYTTFDPPGSSATQVTAINATGQIAGSYEGAGGYLSFLRLVNGNFIYFSPTGADTDSPLGMNDSGHMVGTYQDQQLHSHAFYWAPSGALTTFDVVGAYYTFAVVINNDGVIAGQYGVLIGNSVNTSSYVRDKNGNITTFDAPGSAGLTVANSINASGQITGIYSDGVAYHGYVRDEFGNFASFDAPGAGTALWQGTQPTSISNDGSVAGFFTDGNFVYHGFSRDPAGNITVFDAPQASTKPYEGTFVAGMNNNGQIVGYYLATGSAFRGFVRDSSGVITGFRDPGAGTAPGQGTRPRAINDNGKITGEYVDSSGTQHGFLLNRYN